MTRRLVAVLAVAGACVAAGDARAASGVSLRLDRSAVSTRLGDSFSFTTTVANEGSKPLPGLIVHLNVLSVRSSTYVDPEDWSTHRTRYLAPLPAGGSVEVRWPLKAVSSGSFAIYVAVLARSGGARPATTGPTLRLTVAGRRTLDSGGILPLALSVPGCLTLIWAGIRLRRRSNLA